MGGEEKVEEEVVVDGCGLWLTGRKRGTQKLPELNWIQVENSLI